MLAAGALPAAWAQPAIQSITSSQQGGAEVVRIELSEPLAACPAALRCRRHRALRSTCRRGQRAGRTGQEINQGNLRSVAVAQAGDRTRLVLNLKQATQLPAELQGKTLVLC
jgi:type IV pilus assembly protein PilQ